MKSRGSLLAAIAGLLAIAYLVMLGLYPDSRPSFLRPASERAGSGGASTEDAPEPGLEDLVVALNIPVEEPPQTEEEAPAADSPGFSPSQVHAANRFGFSDDECPKDSVGSMLGIVISQDRCTVVSVEPEGPADGAGIQPGDRVVYCNGQRVKCPATLLQLLQMRPASGDVQLTIRRPVADQPETPAE